MMSVVLSWEKERSPVVRVVVVKLLVRWEWVRGKVHVVVDLLVVVWRRVVGPVNVAGLGALSSGLGTARRRSQLGEQQTPNWDGVEDCL